MPELDLRGEILSQCFISPEGCWAWEGGYSDFGYPLVRNPKPVYVHRYLFESWNGPVAGRRLRRTCPGRSCVNPAHWELGRFNSSADARTRILDTIIESDGGCWVWQGDLNNKGYGRLSWKGRPVFAHRLAYETWKGAIAEGLVVDHLCSNPPCCNPDHLEPVTQSENMQRSNAKRGLPVTCKEGHVFAETGFYEFLNTGKGRKQRLCKECHRQRTARYRQQKRDSSG